ncbi:MAG: IS91 family transposase [Thiohalocapsa sp.]
MTESASLQAVMNACLQDYAQDHPLSAHQWQVCHHVLACRTEALGGFLLKCDHCEAEVQGYHACRDRHCPRCQRRASEHWCARQQAAILPVTYHHLVFTLPHVLNSWVEVHDREIYGLLFESVWSTLSAFGADPKRLDGQLGMTAVLHTWGQTLTRHVHLHCLVPGGALSAQGQWHPATSTYLFPVRALSRHVRAGFVSRLRRAIEDGRFGRIKSAQQIDTMLDALMATEWVVYSKPCLTRTETMVDYLGRYSHRIALSDARILGVEDGQVDLAYKDYRDGRHKVMNLNGEELLRRFLLHVLPKGFMRIRHFGFLANRCRSQRLELIRQAIAAPQTEPASDAQDNDVPFDGYRCPLCRQGHLHIIGLIGPKAWDGG